MIKGAERVGYPENGDDLKRALNSVERYAGYKMLHRTNDRIHTDRVVAMEGILSLLIENDLEKREIFYGSTPAWGVVLGTFHDVPEIFCSDILFTTKEAMSETEKLELKQKEEAMLPNIYNKYITNKSNCSLKSFVTIMKIWEEKKSVEAQIIKITDAIDAYGEKMLEIFTGNGGKIEDKNSFINMIPNSLKVFDRLKKDYLIWQYFEKMPMLGLDKIPSMEETNKLPILRKNEIYTKVFLDKINEYPVLFRFWMGVNLHIEKGKIFSGWKINKITNKSDYGKLEYWDKLCRVTDIKIMDENCKNVEVITREERKKFFDTYPPEQELGLFGE